MCFHGSVVPPNKTIHVIHLWRVEAVHKHARFFAVLCSSNQPDCRTNGPHPFLERFRKTCQRLVRPKVLQRCVSCRYLWTCQLPRHCSPPRNPHLNRIHEGRREFTGPLRKPEVNIINVIKLLNVLQSFLLKYLLCKAELCQKSGRNVDFNPNF